MATIWPTRRHCPSCTWAERGKNKPDRGYRYFLVFQDKDISMTGAYPMSEFLKILAVL